MYTLPILFGAELPSSDSPVGGPFLDRARAERERGLEASSRVALAAYLVVRTVHLSLAPERGAATEEGALPYVAALPADEPEVSHLRAVLGVAVHARTASLHEALVAYALFLEEEGRSGEALAAFALAARSAPDVALSAAEALPLALVSGRLHLELMHWQAARAAYTRAREAAVETGDREAEIGAALGEAAVWRGEGQLEVARRAVESAAREAARMGDAALLARTHAALADVLEAQGRAAEAMRALYEAIGHTADRAGRSLMLVRLGAGLRGQGALEGARAACAMAQAVLPAPARGAARARALLELLLVEAAAGDRVAFTRTRQMLRAHEHWLPPELAVEAHHRSAQGLRQLGQAAAAREAMAEALRVAEAHRLHEWYDRLVPGAEALETLEAPPPPAVLQLAARVCADAAALVA